VTRHSFNGFQIGCTISGADGAVNPLDLQDLSLRFPFVEWGILISHKREDTPRYPCRDWIWELQHKRVRLAAHLCGKDARDTIATGQHWSLRERFRRYQINGYETLTPALSRVAEYTGIILQVRAEAHLERVAAEALSLPFSNGGVLFDPSGGRGIEAKAWPAPPDRCQLGYAGGIGPDNVEQVLHELLAVNRAPFWIDMESGVRTNDDFDLTKVERVLDVVARVNVELEERGVA
jgi:hypothetical protein